MVYLFDNEEILNQDFEYMLDSVSDKRKKYILKYRKRIDRNTAILSYQMLRYALLSEYGYILREENIIYNKYGKPYLADTDNIHYNISHCREGIAVAVSDREIGVDIQDRIRVNHNFAEKICSKNELDRLNNNDTLADNLTMLWCMKESYLKHLGIGLNYDIRLLDFSGGLQSDVFMYKGYCIKKQRTKRYYYSYCMHGYSSFDDLVHLQISDIKSLNPYNI